MNTAWWRSPGRWRQLALGAGVVLALAGAFELGQLRAGHNALRAGIAERRLGRELERLRQENRQRAASLAKLETDAEVNRQAYAQVERQLAELQDKLIEQQEEMAFYRGIAGVRGSLAIQEFSLRPAAGGSVQLRFVLAQPQPIGREVRGEVQVRVEGMRDGRAASLDLEALAAGAPRRFAFRYFEELTTELRLPAGFEPQRVVIRVVPATAGLKAGVESFPWVVSS
ncbi:MAG: hypothetical protein IT486_10145 [Gammaproteobacteria bacterium]|nr:hypothetical protein [Gammaproteobacteria bacterium]